MINVKKINEELQLQQEKYGTDFIKNVDLKMDDAYEKVVNLFVDDYSLNGTKYEFEAAEEDTEADVVREIIDSVYKTGLLPIKEEIKHYENGLKRKLEQIAKWYVKLMEVEGYFVIDIEKRQKCLNKLKSICGEIYDKK